MALNITPAPTGESVDSFAYQQWMLSLGQLLSGTAFDEATQDAIGTILVDTATIDFTYTDGTPSITADVKTDSINDTHIDWGTGANQVSTTDMPEGTNLYYTDERAQDATGAMVTDGSLVYVDATPLLTRGALSGDISASQGSNTTTLATVNANVGSFGTASAVGTFTVNGKGLITAASNTTIAITASQVSDFNEAAQDAVGGILTNSSSVTFTYDDTLNTITATVTASGVDHGGLTGLGDNDHPQYLLLTDIDDVPVDAVTNAPISSNWAFDHVAAADPHTGYRLESADHTHQSTGAQAGQLDHGLALTGLTDDDHTQYLLAAGTRALSADWDAGSFEIRAQTFESDVITGTAPLVVASTTKVTNLNADLLDDQSGAYYRDSANFTGVNWTDLTDAGATTLHKHDHGGMDGLTDDDHGHYWNAARGAARVSLRI